VVKDILGTEVDPPGADGRTLTLIRYTIPAGAKLAPHVHPGVQVARISAGELTYTVVDGTAFVRRKGATEDEELTAPTTTKLLPGDTVTELDGMVHFGANDTDEVVIIDATLLTEDGKDLAVPVTTP
jgi:quercetin dioxygenase-like cupin family protein